MFHSIKNGLMLCYFPCSELSPSSFIVLDYFLKLIAVVSESNGVQCSASHFIVPIEGGGGPIAVVPLDQPIGERRFNLEKTMVFHNTHSGAVLDTDFSPFRDNIFGTAGEDALIRLWQIPEEGIERDSHIAELNGHQKKINTLRFNPCAAHVMASGGADQSVRIWDISSMKEIVSIDNEHSQQIVEVAWDVFGRTIASSCKDKNIRIMDPRSASVVHTFETAHEGNKSMKLTYLGDSDLLLSTGCTKMSTRQFKLWDGRNTKTELAKVDLDQAAGVIMPFFDADTCILYLGGKGDGNIRYYELSGGAMHFLAEYKSSVPQKGLGMVPKRGVNVLACETARFLKTSANNTIEPVSFIVPRKSDAFQDDIFPDTWGTEPALSTAEWLSGIDRQPKRIALNPTSKAVKINHSPLFGELPEAAPVAQVSSPISRERTPPPSTVNESGQSPAAHMKTPELEVHTSRVTALESMVEKLKLELATALDRLREVESERDAALERLKCNEVNNLHADDSNPPAYAVADLAAAMIDNNQDAESEVFFSDPPMVEPI